MPKALHDRLRKQARKKGLTGEQADRYVYGTLHRVTVESANPKPRKRKKRG